MLKCTGAFDVLRLRKGGKGATTTFWTSSLITLKYSFNAFWLPIAGAWAIVSAFVMTLHSHGCRVRGLNVTARKRATKSILALWSLQRAILHRARYSPVQSMRIALLCSWNAILDGEGLVASRPWIAKSAGFPLSGSVEIGLKVPPAISTALSSILGDDGEKPIPEASTGRIMIVMRANEFSGAIDEVDEIHAPGCAVPLARKARVQKIACPG